MIYPNQIPTIALIEIENELNRAFELYTWRVMIDIDKVGVYFWTKFAGYVRLPEPNKVTKALQLQCSWANGDCDSYKIESGKIIYSAEIDPREINNRVCTKCLLHYQDVYEIFGADQEFVGRFIDGEEIHCNSHDPECDCLYHFWEPDTDYADCDVRFEMLEEGKIRDVYECKRCESNCIITSFPDDEGNAWPQEALDGQLCSCSKWERKN